MTSPSVEANGGEMIRRVAQAQVGGHRKPTQLELIAARVAIQAMREPTDRMIEAGVAAASVTIADEWRAMIAGKNLQTLARHVEHPRRVRDAR